MSTPQETVRGQWLTFFDVPEGEGQVHHTVPYTVYNDGSLTLPRGYTQEQQKAMIAYLTYDNAHMRELRGNSLSVMSEQEGALYWAVIDTLKSPAQKREERIREYALSMHSPTLPYCKPFVSWYEVMWEGHQQQFKDKGDCPQESELHTVHVTESYDNTFSYRDPRLTTEYIIEETRAGELSLIQARCSMWDCEKYLEERGSAWVGAQGETEEE